MPLPNGTGGSQQTTLRGAPRPCEAVSLTSPLKPTHNSGGVTPIFKALKRVRCCHDPTRSEKALKNTRTVIVEILRFVHEN